MTFPKLRAKDKPAGYRNFYIILLIDAALVVTCFYLSFLIRFEFSIPDKDWGIFVRIWPWVLVVKLVVFYAFGMYRGVWRYTGLVDLINVMKAVATGSLIVLTAALMIQGIKNVLKQIVPEYEPTID